MLELFILETCPYCRKTLDFMNKYGISFETKDVTDKKNFDLLMQIGGKDQVPFLYDSDFNRSMYDSDNIIDYVKSAYVKE